MANNQIALLSRVPDLPTASDRETAQLNLQALRDAAKVRQQGMADDAATRGVYAANPDDPQARLKALYAVNPKAGMAAEKAGIDMDKDRAAAGKTAAEGLNLRTARYKDALNTVTDRAGAAQWVQAMYADPDIGKHIAQELGPAEAAIARIPDPATDPQGFAAWKRGSQLGAEKLAEISKPVLGKRDLGGTVEDTATDPFTGVVRTTGTSTKTQSPDNVATNARIASEGTLNRSNQLAVQDRIAARQPDGTKLTADDLGTMAEQYLAGDKSVLQGLGRGQQGAEDIRALRAEIGKRLRGSNLSGADQAAKIAEYGGLVTGLRATGNISARVENAAEEAAQLAPLALAASKEVARSGFLPFGKAQIMFDTQTNDPALARFATANTGLATAYASAMARGNKPTVSDNDHARQLLLAAKDDTSYAATVGQMMQEIEAAKRAPRAVRGGLTREISARPAAQAALPGTNAQGWALHVDAQGNRAYVSPDGRQFQEVK